VSAQRTSSIFFAGFKLLAASFAGFKLLTGVRESQIFLASLDLGYIGEGTKRTKVPVPRTE
jgi:hypothetical protein